MGEDPPIKLSNKLILTASMQTTSCQTSAFAGVLREIKCTCFKAHSSYDRFP